MAAQDPNHRGIMVDDLSRGRRPLGSLGGVAEYATDAAGNVTGLVGPDGTVYGQALTIYQFGVPLIMAPSGSMGNNGAITLGTALDRTYENCYLWLPANAIYAGSAAGLWYAVMSSTTVGTVYNNAYATGQPAIPTTPTAFSTTGPGAYTQVTSAQTLFSCTIPGGSMGINGDIEIEHFWKCNNDASTKDILIQYGGSSFLGAGLASQVGAQLLDIIRNRGRADRQVAANKSSAYSAFGSSGSIYQSIDSTVDQQLVVKATLADATDYMVLTAARVTVRPFT